MYVRFRRAQSILTVALGAHVYGSTSMEWIPQPSRAGSEINVEQLVEPERTSALMVHGALYIGTS